MPLQGLWSSEVRVHPRHQLGPQDPDRLRRPAIHVEACFGVRSGGVDTSAAEVDTGDVDPVDLTGVEMPLMDFGNTSRPACPYYTYRSSA